MNSQKPASTVGAVGTFDGFHKGHQAIVEAVLAEAETAGKPSCVITFSNHPLSVIAPERAPKWAYPREQSADLISSAGINDVFSVPFTEALQHLTAEEFLHHLRDQYGIDTLVMGYDNTFGSDRLSTPGQYAAAGKKAGVRVLTVPPFDLSDGTRPSSSALRHALAEGEIERYEALAGHMPLLAGTVKHGKQNGRKIGIPTLNVDTADLQLPRPRVYAARYLPAVGQSMPAVLNVGSNPTISTDNPQTVELHVPDVELGDMYGREVRFELLHRLRDEQKFNSLEALRVAIQTDILTAKALN